MVRRSSTRDDAADLDLVALDPVTGDSFEPPDHQPPPPAADAVRPARRARRRRRVAAVLAGASLASALMAGWFELSIRNLRGVERTWRSAMAVDAARASADNVIRAATQRDPDAARAPLGLVGAEEATRLQAFERALDRRHILDPKVSGLRDDMVKALRFRRFQMSPERVRIGSTPLIRVDGEIDDQFDRWGLHTTYEQPPKLASARRALAGLRQYSSRPTGATLAALTGDGRLVEVDVDHSRVRTNPVGTNAGARPTAVLAAPDAGAAVTIGETLFLLTPRAADVALVGSQIGLRGATQVFAAGPSATGPSYWLVPDGGPSRTVDRATPGSGSGGIDVSTAPEPIPPGRIVVGAAGDELILTTNPRGGQLERWNPTTGETTLLAPIGARFLAGNDRVIAWQGPLDFTDTGNGGFMHVLHLDTGNRELVAIPHTDAASAAISPDGKTIAVAAGPLAGRLGSVLLLDVGSTVLTGTAGPRVAVDGPAMTWSPDSRTLFWRTPDGELAVLHPDGDPRTELLRTGLAGVTAVVAFGR